MTRAVASRDEGSADRRGDRVPERPLFWLILAGLLLYWTLFFQSVLPNNSPAGQPITRWDVVTLLPEIFGELLFPTPDPETTRFGRQPVSGVRYLPQRLPILLWCLIIVAASGCLGRLVLRRLGVLERLSVAERWGLALGLGHSLLSLLTLGLGLAGGLSRSLFLGIFAAIIGTELTLTWRRREQANPANAIRRDFGTRRFSHWCLAACGPFVLCMLLGSLLPATDFDVKEYHLQGPKEYFLEGRIHFLRHNVYTSFPFLTEMLSLAGMVLYGDWYWGALVGQAVLMTFAPVTALAVFSIARRITDVRAGWLAALAYLSTPWTYRISIIAYTEGALCCYVALTLLSFLILRDELREAGSTPNEPGRRHRVPAWSLITGFLAGSAVATKYPGLVLVTIPFFIALTVSLRHAPRQIGIAAVALYSLGVFLAFGPWMLKNMIETGNPVYPLLYSVFGGIDWTPELNEQWRRAHGRPPGVFASLSSFLRDLGAQIDAVAVKNDWQSPLLFGMGPLSLLSVHRKRLAGMGLYAGVILLAWYLLTHRIDRFWVPVIPVLAVFSGIGLAEILRPSDELIPWRLRPVVTMLLVGTLVFQFGFIVTPLAGYNAYLIDYAVAREQTKTPAVAIIESLKLDPQAKVLFVGEAQLFDAPFGYAYNTVFDENLLELWTANRRPDGTWELRDDRAIRDTFEAAGITHVLVNWNEILRYRTTYGYTPYVTPERLAMLAERGLLTAVPLPFPVQSAPWERLDESSKREIEAHLPELKIRVAGEDLFVRYQVFAYNPESAPVDVR